MPNKHKLHIARRIMVRLARIYHQPLSARSIYRAAACFLAWEREHREAWLEARYEDLTKYVGFSEEELAEVLL